MRLLTLVTITTLAVTQLIAQTPNREALTSEIETLNKDITKLEKSIDKNQDRKRDAEKAIREGELEKKNSELAISDKKKEIELQRDEIGTFDLEGLQDQVKRLEQDKK